MQPKKKIAQAIPSPPNHPLTLNHQLSTLNYPIYPIYPIYPLYPLSTISLSLLKTNRKNQR